MTDTPGMTVTLERKAASQVALQVEASAGEVDAAIEASLRRLASRVRIPGFRPGKAPAAMVERAVGWEAVRHETVDHLVPDLYRRAVDEAGVEPVTDPELDLGELERDKPLRFTATVTVKPEVDLRDYQSLRVPMETTEITDEKVDEAIQSARRRHGELVDVDRAAQAGDVIRCTLVMRRGDEVLSGGDAEERDLELDREQVIPAIVDGVLGLTAGESRDLRDDPAGGLPPGGAARRHGDHRRHGPRRPRAYAAPGGRQPRRARRPRHHSRGASRPLPDEAHRRGGRA